MLRLSTEYHVKRTNPLCVAGVAIRKIASMEDDRLVTEVSFASIGMYTFLRHEIRRGPLVERVQILFSYCTCFSTALIQQLQL
jgi:hypothetical protein